MFYNICDYQIYLLSLLPCVASRLICNLHNDVLCKSVGLCKSVIYTTLTDDYVVYSSMNEGKDFKSRSKKRKREEGKSPFLKGC